MKTKMLEKAKAECVKILTDSLFEFVRENGQDCTDYERNMFDLEDEATKVYNFYDGNGCWFFEQDSINSTTLDDIDEDNYYDKLYEAVTFTTIYCLYIVDGNLKYYSSYNGGVKFDDEQALDEHDFVANMSLLDIEYVIKAIDLQESKKTR